MRDITIKVYKFKELSEEGKSRALDDHIKRNQEGGYSWDAENYESWKSFCGDFGVKMSRRGDAVVSVDIDYELHGVKLANYLWRNHFKDIFRPKEYWICDGRPNCVGENAKRRKSKLFLTTACPTGYYLDEIIRDVMAGFCRKPDSRDILDLADDAFREFEKQAQKDHDEQDGESYFADLCEANDYEFYENGRMY